MAADHSAYGPLAERPTALWSAFRSATGVWFDARTPGARCREFRR